MHANSHAIKALRGYSISCVRVQLFAAFVLSSLVVVGITVPIGPGWSNYSGGSWATGIVVPQNASLKNGSVDWRTVTNVTSVFRVPNISTTDGTVYIIMSVMASNGAVMQVAVGLYNSSSLWNGYAMYILNPEAVPQNYEQATVGKNMSIAAGDMVSMELYNSNGWRFSIKDLSNGLSSAGRFDANFSPELASGGQYIFALESYSLSYRVFENMGNLSLFNIFINGKAVTYGMYIYSPWTTQPLFIVGGSNPPPFISVKQVANETFVWSA